MPSSQSLCVHAHFYQPSRKDLLTGEIPTEDGAWPFQNWNERIYFDCYHPNVELENFSKISFNIGPTLSQWLRQTHPETLQKIVLADQNNLARYGVGNAMAQPYHHTILPLATRHDKQTQVRWGIFDFEQTFGHPPRGMWLPETAVDLETLEVLIENGIEFTILAPWQTQAQNVDIHRAHQVILPGHQSIKVFFYHSGLSSRVSFDPNATVNADNFVSEYVKPEFPSQHENQFLMMASDGELYGHHQIYRDKFLAYLLNGSLSSHRLDYSYPALQLMKQNVFPVVKLQEKTSWSCHHGVKRWMGVCACTPNGEWKKHLRFVLERLNSTIEKVFLNTFGDILSDPWEARNAYAEIFSGNGDFYSWIQKFLIHPITSDQRTNLQLFFEALVDAQSMFTSCGWFFDDFDRIEPRNNVTSAAHAIWLIKRSTGYDLTFELQADFARVRSWKTGLSAIDVFDQAMKRFENSII